MEFILNWLQQHESAEKHQLYDLVWLQQKIYQQTWSCHVKLRGTGWQRCRTQQTGTDRQSRAPALRQVHLHFTEPSRLNLCCRWRRWALNWFSHNSSFMCCFHIWMHCGPCWSSTEQFTIDNIRLHLISVYEKNQSMAADQWDLIKTGSN